jgi:hypothetical protein
MSQLSQRPNVGGREHNITEQYITEQKRTERRRIERGKRKKDRTEEEVFALAFEGIDGSRAGRRPYE